MRVAAVGWAHVQTNKACVVHMIRTKTTDHNTGIDLDHMFTTML